MKIKKLLLAFCVVFFFITGLSAAEQEVLPLEITRFLNLFLRYNGEENVEKALDQLRKDLKSFKADSSIFDVFVKDGDLLLNSLGILIKCIGGLNLEGETIDRQSYFFEEVFKKMYPNLNKICLRDTFLNLEMTPFVMAFRFGNLKLLSLLVKYNASPEIPYKKNNYYFLNIELIFYYLRNIRMSERIGISSIIGKKIKNRNDRLLDRTPEIDFFDKKEEEDNLLLINKLSLADQDKERKRNLCFLMEKLKLLLDVGTSLLPVSKNIKMFGDGETKSELVKILRKYKQGRPFVCSNVDCTFDATNKWRTKEQKLLACSACKNIWYCNVECQAADWKAQHGINGKAVCKELKIQKIKDESEWLLAEIKFQEVLDQVD